jgi:hypothetical protein
MKAAVVVLACLVFVGVALADSRTLQERFEEWARAYGKAYGGNAAEVERRMRIFEENERKYAELNAQDGVHFAPNEFSDLTEQEFRQTVRLKKREKQVSPPNFPLTHTNVHTIQHLRTGPFVPPEIMLSTGPVLRRL